MEYSARKPSTISHLQAQTAQLACYEFFTYNPIRIIDLQAMKSATRFV
jgi:hypothetical protein